MDLKRDPEKAAGLGTGKRVNLILDLPRDVNQMVGA